MQLMREAEADPKWKGVKRLKVTDSGLDTQQSIGKTGQRFIYGYGTSGRDAMNNDSSSDSKMLCFASEVKEDKSANTSSRPPVGGISMQDYTGHLGVAAFRGTGIQAPVNPQMAPSWFKQYGSYENGQILGMYDGLDSRRRNAKMAAQQIFFGEAPESLPPTSYSVVADQANAGWTAVSAMKQNWIGHKLRIDGLRRTSEKQKESGSLGESFFANVAEDFIGRARKLESDLLRLFPSILLASDWLLW
ncbi:uncharacterized protein [Aristolochia californica]|uniref:uncharacterized protein isoform X2 n=1 Tax=Aristolochia californica TaxID=171875 RepID=UPI0035E0A915